MQLEMLLQIMQIQERICNPKGNGRNMWRVLIGAGNPKSWVTRTVEEIRVSNEDRFSNLD